MLSSPPIQWIPGDQYTRGNDIGGQEIYVYYREVIYCQAYIGNVAGLGDAAVEFCLLDSQAALSQLRPGGQRHGLRVPEIDFRSCGLGQFDDRKISANVTPEETIQLFFLAGERVAEGQVVVVLAGNPCFDVHALRFERRLFAYQLYGRAVQLAIELHVLLAGRERALRL